MREPTEVVQQRGQRRIVGAVPGDDRCVGSPVEHGRLVESAGRLEQYAEVVLHAHGREMAPRKTALGHRQRAPVHALGSDDVTGPAALAAEPDQGLDPSQTAQTDHDSSSCNRLSL